MTEEVSWHRIVAGSGFVLSLRNCHKGATYAVYKDKTISGLCLVTYVFQKLSEDM